MQYRRETGANLFSTACSGESRFVVSYPCSYHTQLERVMKTDKVLKLKFYCDPGHGWVAVKVSLLLELGITGQISGYSYVKGGTAYLEEDCDAERLIRALNAKGIAYKIEEKHTNSYSPIRNYQRWGTNYEPAPQNSIDLPTLVINQ